MRVLLLILITCFLVSSGFGADNASEDSPNKRYSVTFEDPTPEKSYPKVFLTDNKTHKKTLLFDFDEFQVHQSFEGSFWSQDSRHVAIGIGIERTLSVYV